MTRRSMLIAIGGLGAAAVSWLAWRRVRGPSFAEPLGLAHLDATFELDTRSGWQELGRQYLAQNPLDRDERAWISAMLDGGPACCTGRDELRRVIVDRIAADFENGQTVDIQGWTLSRTEARLAALTVRGF